MRPRFYSPVMIGLLAGCGMTNTAPVSMDLAAVAPNDMSAAPSLRVPELPPVPPLPTFADDAITDAKVQLGTYLFFDPRLSASGHSNCDGCHGHLTAFQDNLIGAVPDRSYPADRPVLTRNTPSFFNLTVSHIS